MDRNSSSCWHSGAAGCKPGQQCFVKTRTSKGGYAQCHSRCPKGWLCETRVAGPGGGHCGAAPLPGRLTPAPYAMAATLFDQLTPGITLCDRRSPPIAPVTEIQCFDGGFTGNRYIMVKNMLLHAACCASIALLPPSFDTLPSSGASCFDFRTLPNASARSCSPSTGPSSLWWSKMPKSTPLACRQSEVLQRVARLGASLHAGFAKEGEALGDHTRLLPARPLPCRTHEDPHPCPWRGLPKIVEL